MGLDDQSRAKDIEEAPTKPSVSDDAWSNVASDAYSDMANAGSGLGKYPTDDFLTKHQFPAYEPLAEPTLDPETRKLLGLGEPKLGLNDPVMRKLLEDPTEQPGFGLNEDPLMRKLLDDPAVRKLLAEDPIDQPGFGLKDDPLMRKLLGDDPIDQPGFGLKDDPVMKKLLGMPDEDPDLPMGAYGHYLLTGESPKGFHLNPYGNEPGAPKFIKDAEPEPIGTRTIDANGNVVEEPPKGYKRNPYGNEPGAPKWVKDRLPHNPIVLE